MTEAAYTAIIQELAFQRNALGDRALNLAGQLADAQEKIKELEGKLAAPQGSNVVEMPDR